MDIQLEGMCTRYFSNPKIANCFQDCAQQDNIWDCGVYTLVAILHRMKGLPQPQSIDAGLWRKVFHAALTGAVESPERMVPSSDTFHDFPASESQPGDGSGLAAVSARWARTYAAIDERVTAHQRSLQRAQAAHQHAAAAHTLLADFHDTVSAAQRQLAGEKAQKGQQLSLHEYMRAHLEKFTVTSPHDPSSGSGSDTALEEAITPYRALVQQTEPLAAEIDELARKEEKAHRRIHALVAAQTLVKGEMESSAARVKALEGVLERATEELRAFYQAQISACQGRLEMLEGACAVGL